MFLDIPELIVENKTIFFTIIIIFKARSQEVPSAKYDPYSFWFCFIIHPQADERTHHR